MSNDFPLKKCKLGFEQAYVKVAQPTRKRGGNNAQEDIYDYDEISATFKVRYLTSMEALLRLYSYKIVQMSHQFYTLRVHDELGQTILVEDGHEEEGLPKVGQNTKLTAFFELCAAEPSVRDLTYDRLPYYYS